MQGSAVSWQVWPSRRGCMHRCMTPPDPCCRDGCAALLAAPTCATNPPWPQAQGIGRYILDLRSNPGSWWCNCEACVCACVCAYHMPWHTCITDHLPTPLHPSKLRRPRAVQRRCGSAVAGWREQEGLQRRLQGPHTAGGPPNVFSLSCLAKLLPTSPSSPAAYLSQPPCPSGPASHPPRWRAATALSTRRTPCPCAQPSQRTHLLVSLLRLPGWDDHRRASRLSPLPQARALPAAMLCCCLQWQHPTPNPPSTIAWACMPPCSVGRRHERQRQRDPVWRSA